MALFDDDFNVEEMFEEIEEFTFDQIKDFALRIINQLRSPPPKGTPVQTGFARNNWTASQGEPVDAVGESADGGIAAILTYGANSGPLFIVNNAPYINRLNEGHSQQTPAGFVEQALEDAKQEVFGL